MNRAKIRDLIAGQIVDHVHCAACSASSRNHLDQDSIAAAADAIISSLGLCVDNRMKWPDPAHVMSKTGQARLERLVRRADFLERRISEASPTREMDRDSAELSAIRWAVDVIRNIGVLEEELD
jgi:hypothetical protein